VTIGDAIGDLMGQPENPEFNHIFPKHSAEIAKRIAEVPEGGSLMPKYKEAYKKSPWDQPSCTIKENHGGTNLHPKLPRCMTAREIARLQSFPDDFIFEGPKSKQLTQIGNAVPPLLGKAIGLAIRKMKDDLTLNN
jgi:DNA (cytosine-5)-methyltransferase 1